MELLKLEVPGTAEFDESLDAIDRNTKAQAQLIADLLDVCQRSSQARRRVLRRPLVLVHVAVLQSLRSGRPPIRVEPGRFELPERIAEAVRNGTLRYADV